MIKVVSFDVHGTLTTNFHVEEFWFRELPRVYANEHKLEISEATKIVNSHYDKVSKKDKEWYSPEYWFETFKIQEDMREAVKRICQKAVFYSDVIPVLSNLSKKYKLVVCSASPHIFLDYDIKPLRVHFANIFSSMTDYGMIGKPAEFFSDVCKILKIEPFEMAHVGDDLDFDQKNPSSIGINSYFVDRSHTHPDSVASLTEFAEKVKSL